MKTKIFVIEALSNLHVGSGEINYGLVDNLIQKDPVTDLPIISSSSLKGALREHFKKEKNSPVDVTTIFGSEPKENQNRTQGSVRFFDADLLSLPVRTSGSAIPFVHATSEDLLVRIGNRAQQLKAAANQVFFSLKKLPKTQGIKTSSLRIEDLPSNTTVYENKNFPALAGGWLAFLTDAQLKLLTDDEHLPIITRNCLDDGNQSQNLFYEQVLPRYSRLVTLFMGEGNEFEDFCKAVDNSVIQIGAHATIGYGFCRFSLLTQTNNNQPK